jgi:hypothetical protein
LNYRLEIRKAQFPVERQIHCLRHFNLPDSGDLEKISERMALSKEEVVKHIKIPGSKFNQSFARDPYECFELLKANLKYSIIKTERENIKIVEFIFSKDLYPSGIGFSNVISLDKLSGDERKMIKQSERDGKKVNILKKIDKYLTWQAVLVVEVKPMPSVITLYPGITAPPLPDIRLLSGEELEKSINFWDNHVFLTSEQE